MNFPSLQDHGGIFGGNVIQGIIDDYLTITPIENISAGDFVTFVNTNYQKSLTPTNLIAQSDIPANTSGKVILVKKYSVVKLNKTLPAEYYYYSPSAGLNNQMIGNFVGIGIGQNKLLIGVDIV